MFTVDNLDELLSRLAKHGAELVGEVVNYENIYRLCYIRGAEGLYIGLAEQLGKSNIKRYTGKDLTSFNRIYYEPDCAIDALPVALAFSKTEIYDI